MDQFRAWTKLPDMKEKRYLHACGVVNFRVGFFAKEEKLCGIHCLLPIISCFLQGSTVLMVVGGADRWGTEQNSYINSATYEILDLSTRTNWVYSSLPNRILLSTYGLKRKTAGIVTVPTCLQEIIGSTPLGIGLHRGRLFHSGVEGRISYVRVDKALYQLNEVRLTLFQF